MDILNISKNNISEAAKVLGIPRTVIYAILSRAPLRSPYKTPAEIEDRVVEAKNQTPLEAKRLSVYLPKYEKIKTPYGTIRHILRRKNLSSPILLRDVKSPKRESL